MSLTRTLLFFITLALIATLALLLDSVALFAQQQPPQQQPPPAAGGFRVKGSGSRVPSN